jgi:hypothetical protein
MDALSIKFNSMCEASKTTQDMFFTWNLLLAYGLTNLVGIKGCLAAYQTTVSIVDQEAMFLFVSGMTIGNTEVSYAMAEVGDAVGNRCYWNAKMTIQLHQEV